MPGARLTHWLHVPSLPQFDTYRMYVTEAAMARGSRWTRGATRWLVTLGATVASAYALDVMATAAGVALVASGLVRGWSQLALLGLLAGSYVAWAAGLRVNLRANQALIDASGTSTNVLSKAAWELARRVTSRQEMHRLAAAAGYVGTEVLKEVPYYAGAAGAVLLTGSVTTNEAIVFLAGANMGAAVYEYGLAGLTRRVLRLRPVSGRPLAP